MRVVSRTGRADVPGRVEIVAANVAEAGEAKRACDGAAVVYHCANPLYAKWPELHPPLTEAIIAAKAAEGAAAASARLVFGDNLYAYGPVDGPSPRACPTVRPAPMGGPGPGSRRCCCGLTRRGGSGRRSGGVPTSSVPTRISPRGW